MTTSSQESKPFVELIRFKDWWFQNGLFLLGAVFSDSWCPRNLPLLAASTIVSSLCLAHGHALNQFFDELKEKLGDNARLASRLLWFTYLLLALALGLSWFISVATFVVVAMIGLTSWFHSSPPFYLKKRIYWRLLLNSFGFSLLFLLGASVNNELSTGELLMGGFIFLLYFPLELIHVLAHMNADKAKGIRTFALAYGEKKTIVLASLFLVSLMLYSGALCLLKFASFSFAGWTVLSFLWLLLVLGGAYRRNNSIEAYERLRSKTKLIGVFYGAGLLLFFVGKI